MPSPKRIEQTSPKLRSRVSIVSAFAIVYLAGLLWIPTIESRLNPLTGDEPFYVITSMSLIHDHDLDEANNYADRDWESFYPALGPTRNGWPGYPDPLPPHSTATDRSGVYSKHGLGMALLIALPWSVGGRTLTLIVLAAIAGLVAANMTMLGQQMGANSVLAAAIAVSLGLTNPLFSFSLLIFPEMTSALCIIYGVRRVLATRNSVWQWLFVGCGLAFLPWLHYRLAPVAVAIFVVAFLQFRHVNRRRDWIALTVPPLVSATMLFSWYWYLYRSPLPPSSDHAGFSDLLGTINGLAGTLYDQQWGAFIHNPILILATIATAPFAWFRRRDAAMLAIVILPYLAIISAYRVWWGEWNPPARYLTDIVPLAVAPLAWWLSTLSTRLRWSLLVVSAIPAGLIMANFVSDPQLMYNQPDGSSRLFEAWSAAIGWNLTDLVPSFVVYSASSELERIWFAIAVSGMIVLGGLLALSHRLSIPSRVVKPAVPRKPDAP